jgi:hypothetical protein
MEGQSKKEYVRKMIAEAVFRGSPLVVDRNGVSGWHTCPSFVFSEADVSAGYVSKVCQARGFAVLFARGSLAPRGQTRAYLVWMQKVVYER